MHQGLWKFSRYFPLIFKLNLKAVLSVLSLFFKLSNFPFTFVMLLCKKRWVKEAHKRGPFRNSYQFSPLFPAYLWWLSRHSLLWSLFQKKCIKSKIKTWKGRYKLHPECLKSPKNLRGTLSLVRLLPIIGIPMHTLAKDHFCQKIHLWIKITFLTPWVSKTNLRLGDKENLATL